MTASETNERRVQFDFQVEFANGGGLQGQGFRLDIDDEDVTDAELADYIVRDMRLLMVAEVRVLNKRIIRERHKRTQATPERQTGAGGRNHVDLSHEIEDGMITYRGLPAPVVCDFLTYEQSREHYAAGTEFQIGRIDMCANTGTYLDSPAHRFRGGADLAALSLDRLADLDAVTVNIAGSGRRAIDRLQLLPYDVAGKAVLIHTGWDRYWSTDAYFERHPFLTEDAAQHLVDGGAALVGIDSLNIDDTDGGQRPVHTILLGAGIPICEHLCNLASLPADGFRFSAVPVKVKGMGSFPVRAYATLETL